MVSRETQSFIKQALIGFGLVALVLLGQLLVHMGAFAQGKAVPAILVEPKLITYRLPGEYLKEERPINGPLERQSMPHPLFVMKYQVSVQDYEACVRDGGCEPQWQAYARADGSADEVVEILPVTGVSFDDANAYAAWLSRKTGQNWRLPSDLEWATFAAERYYDDAYLPDGIGIDPTISQPSRARRYGLDKGELPSDEDYDPIPKALGYFGENSHGIADVSGNIWEWTSSCYMRYRYDKSGDLKQTIDFCGVYISQGKLRSYISGFLRDPTSGACAIGEPPDNLGFRLVREAPAKNWKSHLRALLGR